MHIFTVHGLTQAIKDVLEGEFPFIWVRGQVTNLSRPPSGHIYFSLKDEDATLKVVWFKGAQPLDDSGERINPLTGEVESGGSLQLADGLEVLVAGRMNIYPPRGEYQLVVELVQGQGLGELALAFEAMKTKLAAKGYFDADRKLDLPRTPRRVAVITAPQGAALQDFLRIAQDRGPGACLRIYPSLVQGDQAPVQIAAALNQADADQWAEVLVLIRGGGSLEDLWAFNTEAVAEAIFRARVPVLTGIGHEVDSSIADFVADQRAATPSHAAQLLWSERTVLGQQIDDLYLTLVRSMGRFVATWEFCWASVGQSLERQSPARKVEASLLALGQLNLRLDHVGEGLLRGWAENLIHAEEGLRRAFGPHSLDLHRMDLQQLGMILGLAGQKFMRAREDAWSQAEAALRALDPAAPLARGYALVRREAGRVVRKLGDVVPGDEICVQVQDGEFRAEVKK